MASRKLGQIFPRANIHPVWNALSAEISHRVAEGDAVRAAELDPKMAAGSGALHAISYRGHLRQIQDLIDSLRDNRPVAIDGREARQAVALIRVLDASTEQRAPVKLL